MARHGGEDGPTGPPFPAAASPRAGPALVEDHDATTLIPPGWRATLVAGDAIRRDRDAWGGTRMAILKIAKMGHPVLRRPAQDIADPTDPEIARLAADMRDTLADLGASGLAAPQVHTGKRLVVYRLRADRIPAGAGYGPVPWTTMVNPVIEPLTEDRVMVWERCLSLPGLHGKVPRTPHIRIRYRTLAGDAVAHEATGSHASLLQHECDHLDGVLYPMRMTDLSLLAFNDAPGPLAEHAAREPAAIDPLFLDLVARWPASGVPNG